jgi:hypothetical protein
MVVKNVVIVLVLCDCSCVCFFENERESGRCSRLARIGEDWSHKASTPSNKNTVNFDGRFHDGPNEPPATCPSLKIRERNGKKIQKNITKNHGKNWNHIGT